MSEKVVIVGAGGHAREVLDIFDACNRAGHDYEVLGYIVESAYSTPGMLVNDKPVLGDFDWLAGRAHQVRAVCAVGAPELRRRLVARAAATGVSFCNVIHPTAITTRWTAFGEGIVVAAGCTLTNQIRIGSHVQINVDCTISHDAVLEDFATLSPGVHVAGSVRLGTGCYVGIGVNIINGVQVGEWSVIGAGSTIIKDVPPNSTVVGVPGRVIRTRDEGWHLSL